MLLSTKILLIQLLLVSLSFCQQSPSLAEEIDQEPDPVEALLDRLERSAEDLRDFQANIRYDIWDAVTEGRQTRGGELIYQVDPADKSKRFAINFNSLIIDQTRWNESVRYIFAEGWVVEVDHKIKQFIKRQIVAPGEEFDPLKLGEGPFPLPIGQSKTEVLARFDVSLLDVPSDPFLAEMLTRRDVEGIVLIPKPGTPQAEKFQRVELFYDRATMLPVGINAVAAGAIDPDDPDSSNRKTVLLMNLKRNQGVDESKLSIAEPDKRQWNIDIRPWAGR